MSESRTANLVAIEAERSVLAAAMLDADACEAMLEALKLDDFADEKCRLTYTVVEAISRRREDINLVTVKDEIRARGQEAVLGPDSFAWLVDTLALIPSFNGVTTYIADVQRFAQRRRLLAAIHKAHRALLASPQDSTEAVREDLLQALQANAPTVGILEEAPAIARRVIDGISDGTLSSSGIKTGLRDVDDLKRSGMRPAEFWIIAARPSIGKTSLATTIAHAAGKQKKAVLFFSAEVEKQQLMLNMLQSVAGIDGHNVLDPTQRESIAGRLYAAAEEIIAGGRLCLENAAGMTVQTMRLRAKMFARRGPLDLIVVDYLQLLAAPTGMRGANRQEQVAAISQGLKTLAAEAGVPLVALAQLNRLSEAEDRLPILTDLRDSGSIEQDADVVMLLHREYARRTEATPEQKAETDLIVAKNRNGRTGAIKLRFEARFLRFVDANPHFSRSGSNGYQRSE